MERRGAAEQPVRADGGRSARRARTVPWLVLLLGICITVGVGGYLRQSAEAASEARFISLAEQTRALVETRIDVYAALLKGVAGLFATDEEVTGAEFQAFTDELALPQDFAGVFGVGFSARIPKEKVPELEAHMRTVEGVSGFRHWPPSDGDEAHSIIYLEPQNERNLAAVGFDMHSEPTRRAAMDRARDSGAPALSGKVTLVQEISGPKQAGFLLYLPVYARGAKVRTVEERRASLRGFAYSPFRADDLFSHLLRARGEVPARLRIYDGADLSDATLLHDSEAFDNRASEVQEDVALRRSMTFDVYGRPWTLLVESTDAFADREHDAISASVVAAGLLISLLLFGLVRGQLAAREAAEHMAAVEQRARSEAERASHLKDEFLATVSHELRTPLSAILGWTHILKNLTVPEDTRTRGIEVIERNARAQKALVEDLLDVSRITAGTLRLRLATVDLADISRIAIESVRNAAVAKEIDLSLDVAADTLVKGDATRLQQVAANLLSNAVKFTPVGGRVQVKVERDKQNAYLTVEDSGKGIAAEFIPHVFDPFRQAHGGSERNDAGLGLGLSIVQRLVELHDGSVEVESAGIGRGARFKVRLPLERETTPAIGPTSAVSEAVLSSPALSGASVVLVEDEADTREAIVEVLSRHGIHVTAASSAEQGLALIKRERPDVLVSDIAMPGQDGLSLIRSVRGLSDAEGGHTPALALTAFARPEDRERALAAGFDAHAAKPIEPEILLATIAGLRATRVDVDEE